jgi:2-dehydro-3-deoxy-D-arabinonate dehydratase
MLVRIRLSDGTSRWAVRTSRGERPLPEAFTLGAALGGTAADFDAAVADGTGPPVSGPVAAPVDPDTEVWAAGVTYGRSREARIAESDTPDFYEKVYRARRPELFFKSAGWRVRGPGEAISVRHDSAWNVPEPELALVIAASGQIAGFTICDDVSSRSIEGENPLYLPQAKMYLGATALGPGIVPVADVPDPYQLGIELAIRRDGAVLWSGTASTSQLIRRFDDLIEHLLRADVYPRGVILSTGTCLVPEDGVSLRAGDEVSIAIEGLGTLVNQVITDRQAKADASA